MVNRGGSFKLKMVWNFRDLDSYTTSTGEVVRSDLYSDPVILAV